MIKEVVFDIDDTLYDYEKGHALGVERMAEYAEKELGIAKAYFRSEYKRMNEELKVRLGKDDAVEKLYHLFWDALLAESKAEPGSIEAIRALRKMGIGVGIGTDMTFWMQYQKLERFGFAPYITHMVTSQEAGHEKPHPEFMALCVKKAGCKPEEMVFVGDTFKKDVAGSAKAGMHPVWYRAKEKVLPEQADLKPEDYKIIRHFDELVPYVKSLV